jgi:putative transposase
VCRLKKRTWGTLTGQWVPQSTRDEVIDFAYQLSKKTGIALNGVLVWLDIQRGKFFDWKKRYGKKNEHNSDVPRHFELTLEERSCILRYHNQHPLEGYRRLTFMMMDENVVATSPSTVYRVLSAAGVLARWNRKPSKKGTGFEQPLTPHQHWHVDISYLNLAGTFYYLCTVLDGYSRSVLHWDICESMTTIEVERIIQKAKERYPRNNPRIISDNGPQFIAIDFKEFIRLSGMRHVRTSPYYPQSNGKIERWHKTIKEDAIRPSEPSSVEEARKVVDKFVREYNEERLHSSLGYITPKDCLEGKAEKIKEERKLKLKEARSKRAKQPKEAKRSAA